MGLFSELKRRNVVRMAILYAVAAWLVIQVADVLFDAMELPAEWTRLVLAILLLGFPVALIFSWLYEMTPEGLKRESEVDRNESITGQTGRKLNRLTIALLAIAILAIAADRLIPESANDGGAGVAEAYDAPEFSIAVLPFANRSANEDDVYFVDGIHDDILTQLAHIEALTVTSRTSVERFRGTTQSIPEIAQTLGVRNILEGGIQRAGNRVRINMQLINALNDDHLWAETYERELTAANIFDVQAEIAKAVTQAMQATLQSDEEAELDARPTNSIEAYDLYLLGRYHWNQRTEESIQLAKDFFERAIVEDPSYVLAHSGLADSFTLLASYGNLGGDVAFPAAQQAIDAAMRLDDEVSEVWASLGLLRFSQVRGAEAEEALLRAIALDEKNFSAWLWYGSAINQMRRHSDALAAYESAYSLEPMSRPINVNLANLNRDRGEFVQARQHYTRLVQLDPPNAGHYQAEIAESYLLEGELATAVARYREILATDPGNIRALASLGNTYLILDDRAEASKWFLRAESAFPIGGFSYPMFEHDRDYDGGTAYLEEILARLGHRRVVPVIRSLFRARFQAGDISGAATYLRELLNLLNGKIEVNPSETDQLEVLMIATFLMKHGEAEGFDALDGKVMLDEIHAGLTLLYEQGYRHPLTLSSIAVTNNLNGDSLAAMNFANQAVEHGFRSWKGYLAYPGLDQVRSTAESEAYVARMQAENERQFVKLAETQLAPYVELANRQPIAMSQDAFAEYVGYYSDSNMLMSIYVSDDGTYAVKGAQAMPEMRILNFEEDAFFSTLITDLVIRFGRNGSGELTHMVFESSGGTQRYKRTDPPPPVIELPRETLLRNEGTYSWARPSAVGENTGDADYWAAVVSVDDDGVLWLDFDNQPRLFLAPISETEYHLFGFDTYIEFRFRNGSPHAVSMVYKNDGRELVFVRQ